MSRLLKTLFLSFMFGALGMSLVAPSLSAQTHYVPHIWVGGHGGATLSEMSFSPSIKQSFVPGFTFGGAFRFAEERHVGLQAELNISQRGWQEKFDEGYDFSYARRLTYVEIPVMTHIFFGSRTFKCIVNLGPEFGYMIADNISSNFDYKNPASVPGFPLSNRSTDQMGMDVKNRFDYGITAGLGFELYLARRHSVFLEARYYFGLGNIYPSGRKDEFSASRGTSILVTAGYFFRIK